VTDPVHATRRLLTNNYLPCTPMITFVISRKSGWRRCLVGGTYGIENRPGPSQVQLSEVAFFLFLFPSTGEMSVLCTCQEPRQGHFGCQMRLHALTNVRIIQQGFQNGSSWGGPIVISLSLRVARPQIAFLSNASYLVIIYAYHSIRSAGSLLQI
jgi:hypothetical protein